MENENETVAKVIGEARKENGYTTPWFVCFLEDGGVDISELLDRIEAAYKRGVKELCDTLRRLVEDTCGHCDARCCQATCHNGEPKIPCRVVYDSLQVANRFDPPPKPTTEDDDTPF